MKDNLGHRIGYVMEEPGGAGKLVVGTVVDYSADGMEVHIRNDAECGGELVKFPVGHLVVKEFHGLVPLPESGAHQSAATLSAEEQHEASRVNARKPNESQRKAAASKKPLEHGAAAAGPDEFADPKA